MSRERWKIFGGKFRIVKTACIRATTTRRHIADARGNAGESTSIRAIDRFVRRRPRER